MKKLIGTLAILGAAYLFTPGTAMADGVSLRIGFGFPVWHRPAYVVHPRREVVMEHPYFERREVIRRDWDHDGGRERHDRDDRHR